MSGLDLPGGLVLAALAMGAAAFAARPEVWARVFLTPIDARPLGLMRIAVGTVVLWTFLSMGPVVRFLFTDEGLWLTGMARARFGAPLGTSGSLSILHWRSDPPLVFAIYAGLLVCLVLMTAGAWTGWTTALAWLLAEQIYGYASTGLYGADRVVRVYLFLAMFSAWGEAYSVDSWRARRGAVLAGAPVLPARPPIAAWPARLMMIQLACIYCSSGLAKSGITWRDGTALYYVLNGDHLYRFPAQTAVTWLHYAGVLPALTRLTRWWELLFPVVLLGVALQGYERDRQAGRWPGAPAGRRLASWGLAIGSWSAMVGGVVAGGAGRVVSAVALGAALAAAVIPLYRHVRSRWPRAHHALLHWVLGRRTWIGFGVLFHLGIEAGTNIGTFPAIMLAVYFCWLSGPEVGRLVAWLFSRPVEVRYHPDVPGVRRAALVRLLAPQACGAFIADPALPPASVRVESAGAGSIPDRALGRVLQAASRL